jgi:hypothetical protein
MSTFANRDSITPIFVDTFDPPTIAANGFFGLATAPTR